MGATRTQIESFTFFKSYADVYNALNTTRDKVKFMDALLNFIFNGIEPDDLKGEVKLGWIGCRPSLSKSRKEINKWIDKHEQKLSKNDEKIMPTSQIDIDTQQDTEVRLTQEIRNKNEETISNNEEVISNNDRLIEITDIEEIYQKAVDNKSKIILVDNPYLDITDNLLDIDNHILYHCYQNWFNKDFNSHFKLLEIIKQYQVDNSIDNINIKRLVEEIFCYCIQREYEEEQDRDNSTEESDEIEACALTSAEEEDRSKEISQLICQIARNKTSNVYDAKDEEKESRAIYLVSLDFGTGIDEGRKIYHNLLNEALERNRNGNPAN